tara:strand:+ start:276 stop:641 length:366 start_codon:yes stop_codon:yes gene_type:complete
MVTLSIACGILFAVAVGLIAYIRVVLKKLLYVSETIGDFLVTLDNYAGHLESVYEMETFYGDETLESLLKHTAEMIKEVERFDSIYSLTTELGEEGEGEDEGEDEEYVDEEEEYYNAETQG